MLPPWVERWNIPTPFPVGDVNAWFLPGDVPTLIDPGPKTPEAWKRLSGRLEDRKIRRVVFTHHHADHSGLARRLRDEHGVEVAAHPLEARVMRHWSERGDERIRDYEEGLRRAAVPSQHRERMRYGGIKVGQLADSVEVDLELVEGQSVQLGTRRFRVLHAPGHTAGSILLRSWDGSVTFSGDTLLERITPNALSVRLSERGALPAYLGSLQRLQREVLGTVLPGHGNPFLNPQDVIRAGLRHAELRQERILKLLEEAPGTAYDVTRRLFPRIADSQLFLAVSETLGHLEHLVREGKVLAAQRDGVDHYAPAPHAAFKPPPPSRP